MSKTACTVCVRSCTAVHLGGGLSLRSETSWGLRGTPNHSDHAVSVLARTVSDPLTVYQTAAQLHQ